MLTIFLIKIFIFVLTISKTSIVKWKVISSYVGYDHAGNPGKDGKRKVFARIDILPKNAYQFVPVQDCNQKWTDEMLYKKYGLTEEEIAFIESMIRPME